MKERVHYTGHQIVFLSCTYYELMYTVHENHCKMMDMINKKNKMNKKSGWLSPDSM